FLELGRNPLGRDVAGERCVGLDRLERHRIDPELENGRETDGTDHAQRVLAEAGAGLADCPEDATLDVRDAVEWIDDRRRWSAIVIGRRAGAPGDRVDREVAPREVEP